MTESWKPIPGTHGNYQISSFGRVKSVARTQITAAGSLIHIKERIIKQRLNSKGYFRIRIRINGVLQYCFVHRLVASAFIPNPHGLNTVNHKDFNPQNNHMSNLEWTTRCGNMQYSISAGRFKRTKEWVSKLKHSLDECMGKPVIGANISEGGIVFYNALNDCKKDGFQPSCVSCCCNGKRNTHKGYTWRFATQDERSSILNGEWDHAPTN